MKYAENEIRSAMRELKVFFAPAEAGLLMNKLKENKIDHVHDFTDTDTITVQEIRAAFKRILPNDCCQRCGSKFHAGDIPADYLLKDISEHREPDYPSGSIWKDADGWVWQRLSSRTWWRMASDTTFRNDAPVRPLTRMEEVPF